MIREIRFAVPGHPIGPNDRQNRFRLAEDRAAFRGSTKLVAVNAGNEARWPGPAEKARLTFVFVFDLQRRRDVDNLLASLKPVIDGIVDAKLILDDSLDVVQTVEVRARLTDPADRPNRAPFIVASVFGEWSE